MTDCSGGVGWICSTPSLRPLSSCLDGISLGLAIIIILDYLHLTTFYTTLSLSAHLSTTILQYVNIYVTYFVMVKPASQRKLPSYDQAAALYHLAMATSVFL